MSNFRFEHPGYAVLLLLLVVGFPIFTWWLRKRRQALVAALGGEASAAKLTRLSERRRRIFTGALLAIGLGLCSLALLNPQMGGRSSSAKQNGADLVIALDISRSMYAQDLAPDRMRRAKLFCERLINRLGGDRVAIVAFAGNAYPQMPLTNDYSAAIQIIQTLSPEMAPTQGTALGEAIELAQKMLASDDSKGKALLIVTDGEDHEEDALEKAGDAFSDDGMKIFTIGAGTSEGAVIPLPPGNPEAPMGGILKDEQSNPVISKMNPDLLSKLAEAGGGKFFDLQEGESVIKSIKEELGELESREYQSQSFEVHESYFQFLLLPALLLLAFELWWRTRSS